MDPAGLTIALLEKQIEPQLQGCDALPPSSHSMAASHCALKLYAWGMRSTGGIFHKLEHPLPADFDPPPGFREPQPGDERALRLVA